MGGYSGAGARIRAVFVAKSDVAGMGPVGWLASFAHTIYVARERRQSTGAQKDSIAGRLAAGDSVILFPEGTNSDGVDVLPFKSALFSVVADVDDLLIQPVTLAYTRVNGIPVTRRQLPSLAWVGDTALGPHFKEFAALGRIRADIIFHPAVRAADFPDRKALARHCEAQVRAGYRQLMRG
ncbi:MAG: lysophospholipid acyltransferase family protein [Sphingomonadales bacterium]